MSGGEDNVIAFPPLEAYADEEEIAAATSRNGLIAPSEQPVSVDDFYAYMPTREYIFTPTRELWRLGSVNARCPLPLGADGSPVTKRVKRKGKGGTESWEDVHILPSEWLDEHRPVEQMTWAPGEPMVIADRLVSGGGWIERKGCSCFNLYRPPLPMHGDPKEAGRWLDHVRYVYSDNADHIIRWLAHRVQRPGEKVNHALVLGGVPGIGKDTILEPVKYAIGPWNFSEVSPAHMLGRFNGFVKSVILRISEAHDLGEFDRYSFYEHMKAYCASPPDVLRCDEKNIREHSVMNVCGPIITTNHKTDGLYLPADDRRHFVAWSERGPKDFAPYYWTEIYQWYAQNTAHVAAYLARLDLSGFDPKAPPTKTPAFWSIVDANRAPEDAELADAIDSLSTAEAERAALKAGRPYERPKDGERPEPTRAFTLDQLATYVASEDFRTWLRDRRNSRQIPHRLEAAGYIAVRNEADKTDGRWKVGGKRQVIYARKQLPLRDQLAAAEALRKPESP